MNFTGANCQGAKFTDAECQGASSHSGELSSTCSKRLSDRLKKPTELENIIIAGKFSDQEIADIERLKNNFYLQSSNSWYENMQQIIANNEGKQQQYGVPKYIISGELGEDEAEKAEIQKIIAQLAEIEKARLDFKDRL